MTISISLILRRKFTIFAVLFNDRLLHHQIPLFTLILLTFYSFGLYSIVKYPSLVSYLRT
jgi:hypothetical protein